MEISAKLDKTTDLLAKVIVVWLEEIALKLVDAAFVAVTRNQDTNVVRFYKNGVLTNTTDAGGYTATANGSSPILIGTGYTTNCLGDLPVVAVYKKELTPAEIQQNFNALRGRFGI